MPDVDPIARLNVALEGRYRIERELGEGGMATVFLADDLRHERKVAVKVLKPELAAVVGAERFLAEIKTTANLTHPHILPLFDSGEADRFLFYVMPHVEGESLRNRLDREHQLPVDDVVRIATNLAEALDYAHRQGVIHRDIKPANVLLLDGKPVLSDFGIALAVSAGGGSRLTETGLSLGTPHYMSPEQATGDQHVGPATDIYALGCVLYEMLVGEPPYTGSTPQAVLGKIIAGDVPSARAERTSVPANVDAAVAKALEKLPADRFPSARVFANALSDPSFRHGASVGGTEPVAGVRHVPLWREALPWALIPLSLLAAALLGWGQRAPGVPEVFDHQLPAEAPMTFTGGSFDGVGWPAFSMSPQEDYFVYVAERGERTELWYYDRSTGSGRAIEGTAGAYAPVVSPDGAWVAFLSAGQLKRVPVEGGSAVPVMDVRDVYGGAHWFSSDGILVYARSGRLRIVDPSTRVAREAGEGVMCHLPHMLEDGHVLCNLSSHEVRVLKRDSVSLSKLNRTVFGTNLRVVGNEYVAFVTPEGDLQIATLDRETLAFGRPVTVRRGLRREADSGAAHYSVTSSGALVYAAGDNAEVGRLVRRSQVEGAAAPLSVDPAPFTSFRISPDAERLAAVVVSLSGRELSVYDLRTGARSDPWLTSRYMRDPVWSPTGSRLAVATVSATEARAVVAFGDASEGAPRDTVEVEGDPLQFVSEHRLLTSAGALIDFGRDPPTVDRGSGLGFPLGTLSPDGSRIAFGAARGGGFDVLVESYPEREHRHVVSPEGGQDPVWLSSSRLAYRLGNSWFTVNLPARPDGTASEPTFWFTDDRFVDTPGRSVVPGAGGSMIYKQATTGATTTSLRVVPNWLEGAMRAADDANSR